MALLGEEIVQEWLNRSGHFTIRGIRIGNDEIDLLAVRLRADGKHELRHIEVQISVNPMSYISSVPKAVRKLTGRAPKNAKRRSQEELAQSVKEFVEHKFDLSRKDELRQSLCKGRWTKELVIGAFKHADEVELLREHVTVHHLTDIVAELQGTQSSVVKQAAGAALLGLILHCRVAPGLSPAQTSGSGR
jgi:hypothetical protein